MAKSEEVGHGIAVCEECDSIQPVEIDPDGELRTLGNPHCRCGSNEFRLLENY